MSTPYRRAQRSGLSPEEIFNNAFIDSGIQKEQDVILVLGLIPHLGTNEHDAVSKCGRHIEIKSSSLKRFAARNAVKTITSFFGAISLTIHERMYNNNELVIQACYSGTELLCMYCFNFRDISKKYLTAVAAKKNKVTITPNEVKNLAEIIYLNEDINIYQHLFSKNVYKLLTNLPKTKKKYLKKIKLS